MTKISFNHKFINQNFMMMRLELGLLCLFTICAAIGNAFTRSFNNKISFHQKLLISTNSKISSTKSEVDDKAEVEEYFNKEGFSRWNKIYSDSEEVNAVQLDIRVGHQQTVDKILGWIENEDNSKKSVCDAGCGVGTLTLPMATKFSKVLASDISEAMVQECSRRAKSVGVNNAQFQVTDMESLKGSFNTVTCIDVMIHYPTDKVEEIVGKLGARATDRLIISFAPKNIFYDVLKKVGELFPGKSKTTRAYLHPESTVVDALNKAGFSVKRKEMTSTKFYYSRLLEAVRE